MGWHRRCTFLDDMMLSHAERIWPRHDIKVINRVGVTVCGAVRPDALGLIALLERGERDWCLAKIWRKE